MRLILQWQELNILTLVCKLNWLQPQAATLGPVPCWDWDNYWVWVHVVMDEIIPTVLRDKCLLRLLTWTEWILSVDVSHETQTYCSIFTSLKKKVHLYLWLQCLLHKSCRYVSPAHTVSHTCPQSLSELLCHSVTEVPHWYMTSSFPQITRRCEEQQLFCMCRMQRLWQLHKWNRRSCKYFYNLWQMVLKWRTVVLHIMSSRC